VSELQEISCIECGKSLGWQDSQAEFDPEMWQHTRCPVRIARLLGLSDQEYENVFAYASTAVMSAYPDFPNNVIGDESNRKLKELRADIAAGLVLEGLGVLGYEIGKKDD